MSSRSEAIFKNAKLCRVYHEKALLAVQNPRLCEMCSGLLTDKNVIQALFSEDGYSHKNLVGLQEASESGGGVCRLFLLQDPDPDERRLELPLSVFAEGDTSQENSETNIKSLYFSSLEDMFELKLSVAALGNHTSTSELQWLSANRRSCEKFY